MIIDCISDLHGYYPKLEGGDLLIVAGDLTARHTKIEFTQFANWYQAQDYKKKVLIAGNHDGLIQSGDYYFNHDWMGYLCDSGTEFEGLKLWGSPWTKTFAGMNSKCKAFTVDTEEELMDKFALIPNDTDILITHSPPYRILDKIKPKIMPRIEEMLYVGSLSLRETLERVKPKLAVFGHVHENGGQQLLLHHEGSTIRCVNASHVNEYYEPVNKPVRVIL